MKCLSILSDRSALLLLQAVILATAFAACRCDRVPVTPRVLQGAMLPTASAAPGNETTAAEAEAVSHLNVHVAAVVSGGHWCREEEEGFYRVVVLSNGIEEVYHHLYIQLMRVDSQKHDDVVDRTHPVTEAQGLDLVFSNLTLTAASPAPCADALVEATVSRRLIDGHRLERFRMRIGPNGHYRATFEPAAEKLSQD